MNIKAFIKNNTYIRNILSLSSGTILAQIIAVSTTPIVTRLYSVEQMGAYYLVLTLVTLFSPVINGRYEMAIVTAKDEKEASLIAMTSIIIGLINSIIICIGLSVFLIFNNTVFSGVEDLVYFSIPILLVNAFINVLVSYNNRHKHYKLIASVSVYRSISKALGQVISGIFKFGILGLLLSQLLSSIMGMKKQAKFLPSLREIFDSIKIVDLINVAKKHKNQPIFSAPALLMNSLSFSIITLTINGFYSIEDVGYYSLAYSMLGLPITLVSMNVGRVFFARANEDKLLHGNFNAIFKKTALGLSILSIPFFLVLMFISEGLFSFIFGDGWGRAGYFVTILSPMFAIRLIASCLTLSFVIANKQKIELTLQGLFLIETIVVILLGKTLFLNIESFLILYSCVFSFTYFIWLIIMYKISKRDFV